MRPVPPTPHSPAQPWGLKGRDKSGTVAFSLPQDEVRRLGSPYSHCTDGVEGVGGQLLYNASYTLQVSLGPWGGRKGASQGGPRGGRGREDGQERKLGGGEGRNGERRGGLGEGGRG